MSSVSLVELEQGIALLRMDDGQHNHLTAEGVRELRAALAEAEQREGGRVVLLRGRAQSFCAGGTLELLRAMASGTYPERQLLALCEAMLACRLPVLGCLEGSALGGGLSLALCCDVTVASESARYGVPACGMGFIPAMGATALLPAAAGSHLAAEMMLTGRTFLGRELAGRGLFSQVVPHERVYEVSLDLARQIAEKPRHVLEMTKEMLALPRRQLLQEAVLREPLMNQVCFQHPDILQTLEQGYSG
jgi:polyketide biosynthesis enoyl-CoA hydratase PksI